MIKDINHSSKVIRLPLRHRRSDRKNLNIGNTNFGHHKTMSDKNKRNQLKLLTVIQKHTQKNAGKKELTSKYRFVHQNI